MQKCYLAYHVAISSVSHSYSIYHSNSHQFYENSPLKFHIHVIRKKTTHKIYISFLIWRDKHFWPCFASAHDCAFYNLLKVFIFLFILLLFRNTQNMRKKKCLWFFFVFYALKTFLLHWFMEYFFYLKLSHLGKFIEDG